MVAAVAMPTVMPIAVREGVAPHLHHAALLIKSRDPDRVNPHPYLGLRLSQSTDLCVGVTPLHRKPDAARVNQVCSATDEVAEARKSAADDNVDTLRWKGRGVGFVRRRGHLRSIPHARQAEVLKPGVTGLQLPQAQLRGSLPDEGELLGNLIDSKHGRIG